MYVAQERRAYILRLLQQRYGFNGIFFSNTPQSASIAQGDLVDVAFVPQVNEFRGERTVQMNIQDIRPACKAQVGCDLSGYRRLQEGNVDQQVAESLLPDRNVLGLVWRYVSACPVRQETPVCLCRKIVRWSNLPLDVSKLLVCLDIFADVGLLEVIRQHKNITLRVMPTQGKADLNTSKTMQRLQAMKEQ